MTYPDPRDEKRETENDRNDTREDENQPDAQASGAPEKDDDVQFTDWASI